MGLYKDPRTWQTKEFDTASEAAGEGYFEEVKLEDQVNPDVIDAANNAGIPGMEDGEEISISPGLSQAEIDLQNAESKALEIINSFLKIVIPLKSLVPNVLSISIDEFIFTQFWWIPGFWTI